MLPQKCFANGGSGAFRTCADHNDLAAVFFLELQSFFQRISVWFIHGELKIALFNPFAGNVDRRVPFGNLLYGDDNFHFKVSPDGSASSTVCARPESQRDDRDPATPRSGPSTLVGYFRLIGEDGAETARAARDRVALAARASSC